jgi:hypothetical protein
MLAFPANMESGNAVNLDLPAYLVFGMCLSRLKNLEHCGNKPHYSVGKTCIYTEDTAQTHFDLDLGLGQGDNSTGTFSHEMIREFGYSPYCSKDGQGLGVIQMHRLPACPSPMTRLPNSCVDPFFMPPGCLGEQGREAIDYCESQTELSTFDSAG